MSQVTELIVAGIDTFKYCSKCRQFLSLSSFHNDVGRFSGKTPYCKQCLGAYSKPYMKIYWKTHKSNPNPEIGRKSVRKHGQTIKGRFTSAKTQAKKRDLNFDLTLEQFAQLISSGKCHYMGEPLNRTGSGLDRKNSSLGYSTDNCVPCCSKCNRIRGADNITYEEMLEVSKLLIHMRRGGASYAA